MLGVTSNGGSWKKFLGGPKSLTCKLDDNNQIKNNYTSHMYKF